MAGAARSATAASMEQAHSSRCGQEAALLASKNIWKYRVFALFLSILQEAWAGQAFDLT